MATDTHNTAPVRALCQDCLRDTSGVFDSNHEAACSACGGELCDCAGCMETLMDLWAGERDPVKLGLRSSVSGPITWTAAGGTP